MKTVQTHRYVVAQADARKAKLAQILQLAGDEHARLNDTLPPHEWQDWYAEFANKQGAQQILGRPMRPDEFVQLMDQFTAAGSEDAETLTLQDGTQQHWSEFYADALLGGGQPMQSMQMQNPATPPLT